MASSTLVKDALYSVSERLDDLDPQFERYLQREILGWFNLGQAAIATYILASCSRVDAIKLVAGTKQSIDLVPAARVIPGDGSTAADTQYRALLDLPRNLGDDGLTPGRAIKLTDRHQLDDGDPNWHTVARTPVRQFVYDPRTPKVFYVNPGVPASTDWWVEASLLLEPKPLDVDTDYSADAATTLSIDDRYLDDLLNFALAKAYLKDAEDAANAAMAQAYVAMFNTAVGAKVLVATRSNPNAQPTPDAPNAPTTKVV